MGQFGGIGTQQAAGHTVQGRLEQADIGGSRRLLRAQAGEKNEGSRNEGQQAHFRLLHRRSPVLVRRHAHGGAQLMPSRHVIARVSSSSVGFGKRLSLQTEAWKTNWLSCVRITIIAGSGPLGTLPQASW